MKEFQEFRTRDAISVIGSIVLVISLVGSILANENAPLLSERVQKQAQAIAQQLAAKGIASKPNKSPLRRTASISAKAGQQKSTVSTRLVFGSEGRISEDPWGNPYSFRFFQADSGEVVAVLVWSEGANRFKDTPEESLEGIVQAAEKSLRAGDVLRGDDLGFLQWVTR